MTRAQGQTNRLATWVRGLAAALALTFVSLPAMADTYRVDLIVFLDTYASNEAGVAPEVLPASAAIDPQDVATLAASGIRILPDADFALQEQWSRLRNARRFDPLLRLAWTQTDPPSENGPRIAVRYGQPMTLEDPQNFSSTQIFPVEGSVSLLLSRYLHLDADLRYTAGSGYTQHSLQERRRMRRDELHHLDSPKLGVLARVTRVN